jgi:ACT domain-containing protein
MIIHSYFTEGYYPWAELFVKSLRKTNGDDLKVFLSSRNLSSHRKENITKLYPKLTLIDKKLKYGQMAKRVGIDKQTLLKYKNTVEKIHVDKESKVWKLMIAAEDRLKEILWVLKTYKEPMLHVDIDTYVTKDISPILKVVESNDFTTRWRIEKQIKRDGYVKYENRATLISVQGYNASSKSKSFLDTWIDKLCKVPPHKRQTGFGQTSCYQAYCIWKDKMSFGDVPPEFLSPQGFGKGILWGANKGFKKDTLKTYRKHLKENL